ncbi:hypothetical protein EDC96DRAFT_610884 [Choanephora cucurbitarum]|nr:hypothetical protein EDC96DRAFT_610884 [Choanephora cucurbitarum]
MKYVVALEGVFRDAEGDCVEATRLIDVVENSLICNTDSLIDDRSRIAEEPSSIPKLTLPEATGIKKPGRPAKIQRLSALPKDFASAKFRKAFATEIIKEKEKEVVKEDEKKEEREEVSEEKKEEMFKRKASEDESDFISFSADIIQDDVVSTYNPKSGGYCGFRAAVYLIFFDEERFAKLKEAMLSLMSKEFKYDISYEDFYRSSFGMITHEVKMTITCGIDLRKKENEVTHHGRHRRAKTIGVSF